MRYLTPDTFEEACELLSQPDTGVFAGATDLLPQSRAGRRLPDQLIDLKRIPRAMEVPRRDGDTWIIGAATPVAAVAGHHDFKTDFPGIVEGASLIGSDQIQNRASLGGNLCNASPAADAGPAMEAAAARAVIASPLGLRTILVSELCTGPGRTSLGAGEFVMEFQIDRPPVRTSDAYLRFTPRTEMDIAVVGAGARVTLTEGGEIADAVVVLGAVAPTRVPVAGLVDVVRGRAIDDELLDEVAVAAEAVCNPIDDKRGTKEYRVRVAGVLAKRAVAAAAERASHATGSGGTA